MKDKISLRGILGSDADVLFPFIFNSTLTDTIMWDGPTDLNEYRSGLALRERQHANSEIHMFTIVGEKIGPIGCIDIRPENDFRANMGLWIASQFHGQGYGAEAVRLITEYGFNKLGLQKINAMIFVGNFASRKIFEKNGFLLEGTIRHAAKKRGKLIDEWSMGKIK